MHNKLNFELASFTTNDPSRYSLNCVQVKQDSTVVTNGHYAIIVTTDGQEVEGFPELAGETVLSEFEPFLLPAADASKIAKAIPRSKTFSQIEHAAICKNGTEKARIAVTDLDTVTVFEPRKGEYQFPNIDAVVPKDEAILTVAFDATYIAKLGAFAAKFGKTLKFTFYSDSKPAKLEAANDGGQSMTAYLMPQRL